MRRFGRIHPPQPKKPGWPVASWLSWMVLGLIAFPAIAGGKELPSSAETATVIELKGPIDRAQFQFFQTHIDGALRTESDLIVLVIDSPGGLLNESLEMAQRLREIDSAHTIAYIPSRALSGAALLSLGCDSIVLGPQARWGDAGVIQLDETFMFQYVEAKVLSDVVRQVRDLAESQGRSPNLAEALVDRSAVVFRRPRPDGQGIEDRVVYAQVDDQGKVAVEAEPPASGPDEAAWELVPETRGNRFLEVNTARALELGLADREADSLEALLSLVNLKRPPRVIRYTTTDSVVFWLTRPFMTFVLILIGLVALYFELSAPGISVGGLIAGLCFVLFFWSRFMGGTAGLLEILLFLSGCVFLLMELFVIPGFGVSGVLGLLLMLASVIMAGQRFIVPGNALEWTQLAQSLGVVLGALVCFGFSAMVISRRMGSIPVLNRLILSPDLPEPEEGRADATGSRRDSVKPAGVKVGQWGVAESVLRPAGKVRFERRSIDVVSDGSYVEPGTPVQVVEISGNRIVVAPDLEVPTPPSIDS